MINFHVQNHQFRREAELSESRVSIYYRETSYLFAQRVVRRAGPKSSIDKSKSKNQKQGRSQVTQYHIVLWQCDLVTSQHKTARDKTAQDTISYRIVTLCHTYRIVTVLEKRTSNNIKTKIEKRTSNNKRNQKAPKRHLRIDICWTLPQEHPTIEKMKTHKRKSNNKRKQKLTKGTHEPKIGPKKVGNGSNLPTDPARKPKSPRKTPHPKFTLTLSGAKPIFVKVVLNGFKHRPRFVWREVALVVWVGNCPRPRARAHSKH